MHLMRPDQHRHRQIQQTILVLKNQTSAFFADMPVLAENAQRRANTGGLGLDHLQAFVFLRADDRRHTPFQNTRLFTGYFSQSDAQILLVIDGNRGDDRKPGVF